MSDDKKPETVEDKLEKLFDRLDVLTSHARILERHDASIRALETAVSQLQAGISTVIDSQREANQLIAGIHGLWAKLACNRPKCDTPSSEFRVVGGED